VAFCSFISESTCPRRNPHREQLSLLRMRSTERGLRGSASAPRGSSRCPSGARTAYIMHSGARSKMILALARVNNCQAACRRSSEQAHPPAVETVSFRLPDNIPLLDSHLTHTSWRAHGRGRSCRSTRRTCRTSPRCRPTPHREMCCKTSERSPASQLGTRRPSSFASAV